MRADIAEQQRAAVGCRVRHVFAGDRAIAAGPVIDDDGLSEARRECCGDHPRHGVVAAARRRRHHDRDGLDRRLPRLGGPRGARENVGRQMQLALHDLARRDEPAPHVRCARRRPVLGLQRRLRCCPAGAARRSGIGRRPPPGGSLPCRAGQRPLQRRWRRSPHARHGSAAAWNSAR